MSKAIAIRSFINADGDVILKGNQGEVLETYTSNWRYDRDRDQVVEVYDMPTTYLVEFNIDGDSIKALVGKERVRIED